MSRQFAHFPNMRPFPDMPRPGWDWDDEDDDGYDYDDRQFHNGGSAPQNEQEQQQPQQPQQQQQLPPEYFMVGITYGSELATRLHIFT
jgi:hypothetical protein